MQRHSATLPAEQRSGVAITTADTGAAIPITVMREVINTIRKRYGNLYNKVARQAFPAVLSILSVLFRHSSSGFLRVQYLLVRRLTSSAAYSSHIHTAEIRVAQSLPLSSLQ